jgi:hypothetical protein
MLKILVASIAVFVLCAPALGLDSSDLDFDELLFVKRPTYDSSHFYTDFIDGCDGSFSSENGIYILDLDTGTVTSLVTNQAMPGENGIFGRFDLSFDAQKVVFDYKPSIESGFRIWEIGIDGTGLRQLTSDPPDEQTRVAKYDLSKHGGTSATYNHHTDDMHPCYLPDGGICFTSTRCEHQILSDAGYFTTAVLHRMDGDGGNMEQLTNSPGSEFSPTVMNDGRILYTRWEHVDKGYANVASLWSMHPDGTRSVEIFGNNHSLPPAFLCGRTVPNVKNMFICVGAPYSKAGYGTVIRLDITKDIRTRDPLTYVTPVEVRDESGWSFSVDAQWKSDEEGRGGRLYADPYPLSESLYLVSCKYDPGDSWDAPDAYGLYLVDESGNHELINEVAGSSCWQPMPLRPRAKPVAIPSVRIPSLASENLALCVVSDIYRGMDNVERRTVKYIRINEQVPRPWGAHRINLWNPSFPSVAKNAHLGLKVQHGIVPVERDGSAYFTVPANRNIFFQALDENFMEVQRERTYVSYRAGEFRTCVGCHEKTGHAPMWKINPDVKTVRAMMREPSTPGPQPGEETGKRVLHYPTDIQPILDNHCVSCHSAEDPQGDLDLSGTLTDMFSVSYENLLDRDLVQHIDESEAGGAAHAEYLPPLSLGSRVSRLTEMLRSRHGGVSLPHGEIVKLTTWIDSNCQYYGSYYGRRLLQYKEHPNFRPDPTFEQAVGPSPPLPDDER